MNNVMTSLWNRTSSALRITALLMAALLLAGLTWALVQILRPEYGVLFSDLDATDAAAIVERLKHDKIPYRLGTAERSIEVPVQQIHDVRLALMSGDLPLSGGVGFEIFDKQGFGTTEHSQQVSYQRALQGELVRTIGALEHVKNVRVHLVLPQSSLFTRERQQASAAVTVAMQAGTSLQPGQIVGVQRLVAAAVSGLEPEHVVITDQRGITLSAGDAGNTGAADARLQVKRDVEGYLAKKIADMLEGAFGGGQAIVTVDATLNFDNAKTTIQDLLPGGDAGRGEGRVVRRRQVSGAASGEGAVWASSAAEKGPGQAGSSLEVEYQYGKRVAEVVTSPGAVSRMSIGVIVPGPLIEEKRQRITELVRMAAGFSELRGDAISVQALSELTAVPPRESASDESQPEVSAEVTQLANSQPGGTPMPPPSSAVLGKPLEQLAFVAIPMAAALLLFVVVVRRIRRHPRISTRARQHLLEELEQVLTAAELPAGRSAR